MDAPEQICCGNRLAVQLSGGGPLQGWCYSCRPASKHGGTVIALTSLYTSFGYFALFAYVKLTFLPPSWYDSHHNPLCYELRGSRMLRASICWPLSSCLVAHTKVA